MALFASVVKISNGGNVCFATLYYSDIKWELMPLSVVRAAFKALYDDQLTNYTLFCINLVLSGTTEKYRKDIKFT